MNKLNESQLLDLSTIIYLDLLSNDEFKSIDDYVKACLDDNSTIDSSKNNGKYPNGMSKVEWLEYLKVIYEDKELMNLKINNRIDKDSGERMAVFVDPITNNAYVVFRGTVEPEEWMDNGDTLEMELSKHQENALEFIKEFKLKQYASVTATGHSKGGNKAQLIALLNNDVDRAVVFNAPGFSYEFITKNKEAIESNKHKIIQIAAERDYVNCLGYQVADETHILKTKRLSDPLEYHYTDSMMDENFNLLSEDFYLDGPCATSQYITELTCYISKNMDGDKRSEMLNGLMIQFDTEASNKNMECIIAIIRATEVVGFENLTVTGHVPIKDLLMDYFGDDFIDSYESYLELTSTKENIKNIQPNTIIETVLKELILKLPESMLDSIQIFTMESGTFAITNLADCIGNFMINKFGKFGKILDGIEFVTYGIKGFIKIVESLVEWCKMTGTQTLEVMKDVFNESVDWLNNQVASLYDTLDQVKDSVVEFSKEVIDTVVDVGEFVIDSTIEFIDDNKELIDQTTSEINKWWSDIIRGNVAYQNPQRHGRSNYQARRGGRRGYFINENTSSIKSELSESLISELIKKKIVKVKEKIEFLVESYFNSIELESFVKIQIKNMTDSFKLSSEQKMKFSKEKILMNLHQKKDLMLATQFELSKSYKNLLKNDSLDDIQDHMRIAFYRNFKKAKQNVNLTELKKMSSQLTKTARGTEECLTSSLRAVEDSLIQVKSQYDESYVKRLVSSLEDEKRALLLEMKNYVSEVERVQNGLEKAFEIYYQTERKLLMDIRSFL